MLREVRKSATLAMPDMPMIPTRSSTLGGRFVGNEAICQTNAKVMSEGRQRMDSSSSGQTKKTDVGVGHCDARSIWADCIMQRHEWL